MIHIGLDEKKGKGIIFTDDKGLAETIREHFSVKNENAKYMRKYGRFLPPRTYAITPTGRFDPGLFIDICRYIREIGRASCRERV